VLIRFGPGSRMGVQFEFRFEFRSVLRFVLRSACPQLDHRGAHGAVCVLSHRCWQDGSIHYSYCQASLKCLASCESTCAAQGVLWFEPRAGWMCCISHCRGRAFGSAPPSEINLLSPEDTRILLNAPCAGKPNIPPAVDIGCFVNTQPDLLTDARTSAQVA
jgi:hypothetical protein